MSERGVFAVDRGIFTDDLFADEPLTEREAWLWIVAEAAWKARRTRVGSASVELQRGQLCHSVRFMAEAWRWSKSRVDRFLSKLEKRDAITRTSGTATSVVTVCRYDEFQRVCLPERDSDGTESGTTTGQQRDKREDIKTLNLFSPKELPSDEAAAANLEPDQGQAPTPGKRKRQVYPDAFEEAWSAYPVDEIMSKKKTFGEWKKLDEDDRAAVLKSIPPFKAWLSRQRDYRTVHFERYISQRRFDGFAAKAASPQGARGQAGQPDDYLASLSDDRWRDEVRRWFGGGCAHWPLQSRTAPPDDPRTRVPSHILAEMNIHPARARAA